MNKELIQTISETLVRLRFLVGAHFLKPIRERERERSVLPPGFMHIMGWIMSRGNTPVSMTDLAVKACISKPNLTSMVDRLYAEGLVERLADVKDRRIVNVVLTQAGVEFMHRHKAETVEFIKSRLSLLEDSELEKLQKALDDIVDIIKVIGEKQADHK